MKKECCGSENVYRLNKIVKEKFDGKVFYKNLANGEWHKLDFYQQLANIGSEVSRARLARGKNEERFWGAVTRGLELFNLTLIDKRWNAGRKKEICRACEIFCDAVLGGKVYDSDLESLDRYFMDFALLAAKSRNN